MDVTIVIIRIIFAGILAFLPLRIKPEKPKSKTITIILGCIIACIYGSFEIYSYIESKEKSDVLFKNVEKTSENINIVDTNVRTTFDTILETKKEILEIDSVLGLVKGDLKRQLGFLKETVKNARELNEIEKLKIKLNEPEYTLRNVHLATNNKDDVGYLFKFKLQNEGGKRSPSFIKSSYLLFGIDSSFNYKEGFLEKSNIINESYYTENVVGVIMGKSYNDLFRNSKTIFFLVNIEYTENHLNYYKKQQFVFTLNQDKSFFGTTFYSIQGQIKKESIINLNESLKNNNLSDYIIDINNIKFYE